MPYKSKIKRKQYLKKYAKTHKIEIEKSHEKYRNSPKGRRFIKKYMKKYRKIYKQKIKIYSKVYRTNHKKEATIQSRRWHETPKGIYSSLKSNARARNIEILLTEKEFIFWYNKQEKKCIYCGRTEKKAIKDGSKHWKRLSLDRKDNKKGYSEDNLELCCYHCNRIKSNIFSFNEMINIGHILKIIYKRRKKSND